MVLIRTFTMVIVVTFTVMPQKQETRIGGTGHRLICYYPEMIQGFGFILMSLECSICNKELLPGCGYNRSNANT